MGRPRKNPLPNTYSPEGSNEPPTEIPPLVSGISEDGRTEFTITTQQNNMPQENTAPHRYQQQIDFWKRDEYGLLQNVEYVFKDDQSNRIDWFKMIPHKYLVPNRDKFPEGTDFKSLNVAELEENQLLILLAGIRYLCSLRGYTKVEQRIVAATETYAAAECRITFIPNFESEMKEVVFVGEGEAHLNNTKSFARNFLVPIACNRSYVRCVRNFLNINTLAADELGESKNGAPEDNTESVVSTSISHTNCLQQKIQQAGVSFGKIKDTYIREGSKPESTPEQVAWKEKAETWESINDVKPQDAMAIIHRLNKRISKQENPLPE